MSKLSKRERQLILEAQRLLAEASGASGMADNPLFLLSKAAEEEIGTDTIEKSEKGELDEQ